MTAPPKLASHFLFILLIGSVSTYSFANSNEEDPHLKLYTESDFPSAQQCAGCHEQIFEEWSSSAHAYAAISPMFHKFEQAINNLAPTVDSFCSRCHISVGTTLGESRETPIWERSKVALEGITCITCHRVNTPYNKSNGERRLEGGALNAPIFGTSEGAGLKEVLDKKDFYKVRTSDSGRGQKIHKQAIQFEQLKQSEFCVSCHQVAVNQGIALEVVWNQYIASPAHEEGITCQDCHTGKVPGKAEGYEQLPAAIIAGKATKPRKHTNHAFYGPGYSIAHPGIFPHSKEDPSWDIKELLAFDWRSDWGSAEFEEDIEDGRIEASFNETWANAIDRVEARELIDNNLERLAERDKMRQELMENATQLTGPFFNGQQKAGKSLSFEYVLKNINKGHNVPSGSLGAQPQLWLNVVLTGPNNEHIWESGYLDSNGDMADIHSLDVRKNKIPFDDQLFSLQTKFLTTNIKGTDREMYLPVNFDIDQLPFLRPSPQPVTLMSHPPGVRMEARSIPPLGSKTAKYKVPGDLLKKPGKYTLSVRLRYRAEPIYFMKFVGATEDMIQSMNESMLDIHPYSVSFTVK